MKLIRIKLFSLFLMLGVVLSPWSNALGNSTSRVIQSIVEIEINSSINPATLSLFKKAKKTIEKESADLFLVKMSTPGGLVSTTKEIIKLMGSLDVPVILWVGPEGASATSAGAIIASAAHLLYMAPGTNIGAATPIQVSKDLKKESDARQKALNDLKALVRSLSEARNHHTPSFELMIEKANSYSAKEAVEKNIANGLAINLKDLLKQIDGKGLNFKNASISLEVNNPKIISVKMDLGQGLLNILADPSLAYILFLLGAALIYMELQAPGGFIAGAIGVFALLLAGVGFQVLPLHFGALGLIILSFILFVLEFFITSFGILTLAGLGSLITGSLFLFRGDDGHLQLSLTVIVSTVSAITLFSGLMSYFLVRQWKQKKTTHFNQLQDMKAKILEKGSQSEDGKISYSLKCNGEIWKGFSQKDCEVGEVVTIIDQDNENLKLYF